MKVQCKCNNILILELRGGEGDLLLGGVCVGGGGARGGGRSLIMF